MSKPNWTNMTLPRLVLKGGEPIPPGGPFVGQTVTIDDGSPQFDSAGAPDCSDGYVRTISNGNQGCERMRWYTWDRGASWLFLNQTLNFTLDIAGDYLGKVIITVLEADQLGRPMGQSSGEYDVLFRVAPAPTPAPAPPPTDTGGAMNTQAHDAVWMNVTKLAIQASGWGKEHRDERDRVLAYLGNYSAAPPKLMTPIGRALVGLGEQLAWIRGVHP